MGSPALATAPFDLSFRFARDADADAWLRQETRRALERLLAAFGASRVRTVILAGSLARGEGGVGRWRGERFPVSDLDLYVVAKAPADVPPLREARHGFLAANAREPLRADVGVASAADLAKMPDTIANFSLGREGKAVWGDASALALVRRTDPARIPREDALNLVLNRAAEELAALRAGERDPAAGSAALAIDLRGVKTVADVALAILMCRGVCEPAYAGRGDRVAAALADDTALGAAMPQGFALDVARACEWKLSPGEDAPSGLVAGAADFPAAASRALERRVAAVRGFSRWYAGGAADPVAALARSEPLPRAARNWIRHARRSADGRGALLRRVAGARLRPTPRLSVQLAALALYLAWNDPPEQGSWRRAARLLPQRPAGDDRAACVDAAVGAWEREIMNRRSA